jgi:hypothetical protein
MRVHYKKTAAKRYAVTAEYKGHDGRRSIILGTIVGDVNVPQDDFYLTDQWKYIASRGVMGPIIGGVPADWDYHANTLAAVKAEIEQRLWVHCFGAYNAGAAVPSG